LGQPGSLWPQGIEPTIPSGIQVKGSISWPCIQIAYDPRIDLSNNYLYKYYKNAEEVQRKKWQ
jgi:hypothetical protein